jgi:CDGSH-type Zn-finger protein/uncharacterized Fe-S cluster protein YjdI
MTNPIEEVRGTRVIIRFDGRKCIHSRHCVLGRPDVFVPNAKGEWIHPDRAVTREDGRERPDPAAIALVAHNCPSGAITYERLDGGENEAAPLVNVVRVRENGPLAFHAPVSIAGRDAGQRVTLCRCGASNNKPYCDGSHAGAGFAATGEPATEPSEALAVRHGAVEITPRPNGPLQVKGALEVVSGTGRTITRSTESFFCRCGASAKKPFCDGTHKRIGFVTEEPLP